MAKFVIEYNKIEICDVNNISFASNCEIKEAIVNVLPKNDNSFIDMSIIQQNITPIIKEIDFFISYSHDDNKAAYSLAAQLVNKGYKVFLDSIFWDNIDDELDKYNKQFNKMPNGMFDYEKDKKSSSTFHMILTDAIIKTIKNSKHFILIKGNAITNNSKTISPWLFLENTVANIFIKSGSILHEQHDFQKIMFPLNLRDYINVDNIDTIIDYIGKE